MKTTDKTIAALVAAAIWADGEYEEAERITTGEIAEALEFPEDEFIALVEQEIEKIKDFDDDKATEYLVANANEVDDQEVAIVYEALMQIMICDNVLTVDEVNTLIVVADALGMDEASSILLLCDMVKTEPELEVEL
mgnify:FL=1